MQVRSVLREILGKDYDLVSDFSYKFIVNSNLAETEVRETYEYLTVIGLSNEQIAKNSQVLARNPKYIKINHRYLYSLGFRDQAILYWIPILLSMNIDSLKRRVSNLKDLGFSNKKILRSPQLLYYNPLTLQRKVDLLDQLGLKLENIQNYPIILTRSIQTIKERCNALKRLGLEFQKKRITTALLLYPSKTLQKDGIILKPNKINFFFLLIFILFTSFAIFH